MFRKKRLLSLAVTAGVALSGCAPVTFAPGNGLGLSIDRGLKLNLSSCAFGYQSSVGAQMGVPSAAVQAGAIRSEVARIQSKMMMGSQAPGMQTESWKRLAAGGC